MARAGRRKVGEPTVFRTYFEEGKNPALRIIAGAAERLGLSRRGLAERVRRDEAFLRRAFDDNAYGPLRDTIDLLARGVGLLPLRLHAELGDLTPEECDQVFYGRVAHLGIDDGLVLNEPPAIASKQLTDAYQAASAEERNAAAESILLAPRSVETGLFDLAAALGAPTLGFLTRYASPDEEALARIAAVLRGRGFKDDDVQQLIKPVAEAMRQHIPERDEETLRAAALAPYRHFRNLYRNLRS